MAIEVIEVQLPGGLPGGGGEEGPMGPPGPAGPQGPPGEPQAITPQMFGAVGDGVTDDSAAFNAVFTAFAASETSPAGMTSYGNGHLHIPKGKYLINSPLTLTSGKGLGLLITGDGIWTTTLLTTNVTGNLFTINTHFGITIRDLAIIHNVTKTVNPETAWTNKCFAISNSGGGRKFSLENVYISGFDRQISNDDTANGDNLNVTNCIFEQFNTHYWNDSTQTVNTSYSECLFTDSGVGANKCFDVTGGPLSLRNIDCTIQGNFLNLRDTPAKYGATSKYVLDNIALEWRSGDVSAGRPAKFIVVDGNDCFGDIFVTGCKMSGGSTPHVDALWMKFGGPMRIFVKGGTFDRKFELVGHTSNTYTNQSYVEFDGTNLNTTSFVTLTAGAAGSSYPQVVLKNCPGIAELTLAYDNSHVVQPRKVAVITDLTTSYTNLFTATFGYSFYNMPCRIRKIELHSTKHTGTGAKVFSVYSDAARTVLIGTVSLPLVTSTAHEIYDFGVVANLIVTEGLYFSATNADANTIFGNIIIEYDCIGGVGTLSAPAAANLKTGYTATAYNAGTKTTGTFTPDPALGNLQRYINGGAHTLAPPSIGSGDALSMVIQVTNNASAGAFAVTGFTKVTGDPLLTTNGFDYMFYITVNNGFSHLAVTALQ